MEEEETSKEDVLKEETVQEEKKEAIAVVEEVNLQKQHKSIMIMKSRK